MIIEVLHIEDCPSWIETGSRLREALDATGFGETTITYRLLGTSADAAQVPFAGSPTITVDGQDVTGWSPQRLAALGVRRTFQNVRLFTGMTVAEAERWLAPLL